MDRVEIARAHPDILPRWLPSPYVYSIWKDWVCWGDGVDDAGNMLGFCPGHDAGRETEGSAEFNFFKGIMRCQGDPACHTGKRAMSLINALPLVTKNASR